MGPFARHGLRLLVWGGLLAATSASAMAGDLGDGAVVKAKFAPGETGKNLLNPEKWRPWEQGFKRNGDLFVCDNGDDAKARRGVSQHVVLDQKTPAPIIASAWSKAEEVSGSTDSNYALYLDLVYDDGTPVWGQSASFPVGTHDWNEARVVFIPERPVKSLSFHMLMREHAGRALFRDPQLEVVESGTSGAAFDGVPVSLKEPAREGFQARDVAADGDFVRLEKQAIGLSLDVEKTTERGVELFDATVRDESGEDRAITIVYAIPVPAKGTRWLEDPRRSEAVEGKREYMKTATFRAGANGRLSRYPFGAVARGDQGTALGIDMAHPAFYRVGYNAGTGELFLAFDLGLTPEKPEAKLRFCRYSFDPTWEFRAALDAYYKAFPEAFERRVLDQGLWMPFSPISKVEGWEDFGFRIKEGHAETAWDDDHGILTFRYTEPMTWWMPMPADMPKTIEAATAEAKRLAERGNPAAKALETSGYHDRNGRVPGLLRDEPWNKGIVWSVNSAPGIAGETNDFKHKWSEEIRERFYGEGRAGDLDGEYVDSSEGYVTDELDFRRDHFGAMDTPLTFSIGDHRPAIFRGLIAFEYVRGIERDMRRMGKLTMANATPGRLCWLAPLLDVLGTETNWNYGGRWNPMSDAELLYRRALSKDKPYCFLMNTEFENFGPDLVERYMKRATAFGMFPGFFSHNASEGAYFTRPELYNRDRPLFRKYIPLCKLVAEAGWEPITGAHSSDEAILVERFGGEGTYYLTILNDGSDQRTATITLDAPMSGTSRELVGGGTITWRDGRAKLTLGGEDLAILEIRGE